MNDVLENALKETWEKKDRFYEENKDLSVLEILIKLENKYGSRAASQTSATTLPQIARASPLKQLGVPQG
jgi:hypothetical protein